MENVVARWVKSKGKLHFTLIDPEEQSPEKAGELAAYSESFGSDAIMVGGSTVEGEVVDLCVKAIKEAAQLPVILFPSTAEGVSPNADYIFYMMLANSKSRRFLIGEQVKAAPHIKKFNLKTISMGYIVISTSSTPTAVERVGDVERINENDINSAVAHALACQYYGMSCVYLEAGSGAQKPVGDEMIEAVKEALEIPLIVGGGIRNPETAAAKVSAGADVIVSGNIAEKDSETHRKIVEAVKHR